MSTGFRYSNKFGAACDELAAHPDAPEGVRSYVRGIKRTSSQTGYVSSSQAYHVGKDYKLYVNGGRYIKHDWWS